ALGHLLARRRWRGAKPGACRGLGQTRHGDGPRVLLAAHSDDRSGDTHREAGGERALRAADAVEDARGAQNHRGARRADQRGVPHQPCLELPAARRQPPARPRADPRLGRPRARGRHPAQAGVGARTVTKGAQTSGQDELFGHPKGLYVCFFTEMWERFSFYGMKALLLLYLTKYHLFTDEAGYDLLGAYGGLVYCTPVIGGLVADGWLGLREAVIFGGVMLCIGHLGMAIEGDAASRVGDAVVRDEAALRAFYLSLAFIIVG